MRLVQTSIASFSPPFSRTLADLSSNGELNELEFAIAMHLVYAKLAGQEVPTVLPPALLTPSPPPINVRVPLPELSTLLSPSLKEKNLLNALL